MFALAETPEVGAMQIIIGAMTDAFSLVGTIVTKITENPVLLFCLAAGLIPIGISIFTNLKNAARA